mmetsp:Transcript_58663/g.104329  ORF Transcript_58663/g.104329 Transcript_58663/m.104329 type:complete len:392 (-) Transcript_58663:186-1361(-)|eukprot:CAMPEP_0197670062 /NCGR_PEP_ID=MMETSP1338-20131121/73681_1 /TAXON_ID=43686 ORGANISM="Pelagodinium beii, Strain RCC1491" /NCGR_SAMPLE_ID=MMETSP1338 /ASSEMBLY_ACC=CAM_ASM_000754 /LENGTH=391 /DNA_ID=CAMNT_0043249759 /DNA_START=42 /DNA_END=1217 /DNA_ORIENTATION=-
MTQAVPDDAIIPLGNQTALRSLHCSGWDEVSLMFNTEADAKAFQQTVVAKAATDSGAFVTSTDRSCNGREKTSLLLRRVNKVSLSGFPAQEIVTLDTSPARYNEVIKDGNISYSSSAEHPLHLCLGVNVGDATSCDTASRALPVYSHEELSVTCDNCFVGFAADVFANFHFQHFTMLTLVAGFKNLRAVGALELDMNINKENSFLGVDKDLWHAGGEDHPLIDFHIGLIPFVIHFDAKLHLLADMQCNAAAAAKAGVSMEHVIGDNYLTWDPKHLWGHVHGTPTTTFTPIASGSADFDCTGSLSLLPTLDMHMSQILTSSMALTSKVTIEVKGDQKGIQICETASYDSEISSSAQLHMAFNHVKADWGPRTWGLSKGDSKTHCEGNATLLV